MANFSRPKCVACEYGKGNSLPNKVNTIKNNPTKEQDIKKDHIMPGQIFSKNRYILRAPGRLYHQKGKSDIPEIFPGGCVFIDHASGYVRIKHQLDINATETVKAKIAFEREDKIQGVVIKEYHTDNGILNASDFMEELLNNQKKIRFSGAGASHQNEAAERSIKTLVNMARIMFMDAALRFPEDTLYTYLWPLEMDYAVWVYNRIPDMQSRLSAI